MRTTFFDTFYRVGSRFLHWLTAHHTAGYGIHSPYLFYIARLILPDTSRYYAFDRLDAFAMPNRPYAERLFKLVHFAHPHRMLDLGATNGLTTAYLALPHSDTEVRTLALTPESAQLAGLNWQKLHITNATCYTAKPDDTLYNNIWSDWDTVDFVCLHAASFDASASLRHLEQIIPHLTPRSIVVIDGIHASPAMAKMWQTVCSRPDVTSTFDLWQMGYVFFDPQFMPKHYRLRI